MTDLKKLAVKRYTDYGGIGESMKNEYPEWCKCGHQFGLHEYSGCLSCRCRKFKPRPEATPKPCDSATNEGTDQVNTVTIPFCGEQTMNRKP